MVFHEGNNAWVETNHNIKTLNRQIATPVITNNYNLKLDDFIFLKRLSRCLFATSVHHMVHLGVMDFWKYHTIVDENIEYRIPDDCSYASHYKVFVRTQFLVFKSHELREKIRFNISLMSLDEKRMFEKEFNHIYYDEITDFKIYDGEKICSIEKYKSTMINKTPNYCCILKLPCEVHIDTLYVLDKSSFDEYHGKFVKFSPMVESSNKNLSIILIRDNNVYFPGDDKAKAVIYMNDKNNKYFSVIYNDIYLTEESVNIEKTIIGNVENVENENYNDEEYIEELDFEF